MTDKFTVYLVDDDPGVLKSLSRLLRARGYEVKPYFSPQLFLEEHDVAVPGCAILDVSMPGLDGLQLQRALTAAGGSHRPVVFVTGKGDIPTSVRAIKAGAPDFLTKPVTQEQLLETIRRALDHAEEVRARSEQVDALLARVASLTPRERQVFALVVRGLLNKQIAHELGTSERTVKAHRHMVMQKCGVRSVAELVMMAGRTGILPSEAVLAKTARANGRLGRH